MSDVITAPTSETETVKATPKAAKPKAKATAKPKATAKSNGGRIGKTQVRILKALAKTKSGYLSVRQIAEKAEVPNTHVSGFVFFATKAKRAKGYIALAEHKPALVKEENLGGAGQEVNERGASITAAGRKYLETHG